jgi:hypothetical protein
MKRKTLQALLLLTSLYLLAGCDPSGGTDLNQDVNSGKLKYYKGSPESGGIQFEYDAQGRVSLIRVGNLPGIDSFRVVYTNNIATRLMLKNTTAGNKYKTPIFLIRNGAGDVIKVVRRMTMDSLDPMLNVNPRFANDNDPYFTTYNPATDIPSTVESFIDFEYNVRDRFSTYTRSITKYAFTFLGDTLPTGVNQYNIGAGGALTLAQHTTYDTVKPANINPLYAVLKEVPVFNIYGIDVLPRNNFFNEDRASAFLFYSRFLPDAVTHTRLSGLVVQEHFMYEFNTQGKLTTITNRSDGNRTIFTYY